MLAYSKSLATFGALVLSTMALTGCSDDDGDGTENPPPASMHVRKNAKDLTAEERADYVNAVLKMKETPSPYDSTFSYYDQFVQWHHLSSLCTAEGEHAAVSHMNLSFLAWHRQFLYRFEEALREVSGKDITVPYWDWADSTSTPVVFADDFMGGDGDPEDQYIVKSGPFKGWEFAVQPIDVGGVSPEIVHIPRLVRKFNSPGVKLPTPEEVDAVLEIAQFNAAPYDITVDATQNFQLALEGWIGYTGMACVNGVMAPTPLMTGPDQRTALHSTVHPWVGGIQVIPNQQNPDGPPEKVIRGTMIWSTSPNDPVFFLNHANVDRIWHQWQNMRGKGKDNYAPQTGGPHGTNLADTMMPFPAFENGPNVIEDLLDNDKLQITYE